MEPLLLFLMIFFWTPPHFWALALYQKFRRLQARAGVPMLPVVAGPDAKLGCRSCSIPLCWSPIAVAPWPLGYFDAIYGITSLGLGAGMMWLAIAALSSPRRQAGPARDTPAVRLLDRLYLFALFATLLLEVVVRAIAPMFG